MKAVVAAFNQEITNQEITNVDIRFKLLCKHCQVLRLFVPAVDRPAAQGGHHHQAYQHQGEHTLQHQVQGPLHTGGVLQLRAKLGMNIEIHEYEKNHEYA